MSYPSSNEPTPSHARVPNLRTSVRPPGSRLSRAAGGVARRRGRLFTGLASIVAMFGLAVCNDSPQNDHQDPWATTTVAQEPPSACEGGSLESDSLVAFAKKCDEATGITVPAFQCDDGVVVPTTDHGMAVASTTNAGSSLFCDRPNALNEVCDPGSRYQVVSQTDDAIVVAHCRRQGYAHPEGESVAGEYGDIAVIQYNIENGATCFYQALASNGPATGPLPSAVSAPKDPDGAFPWLSPAATASIRCVKCHDNGPFIRSPYLAQLAEGPENRRLPGTNPSPGTWDNRLGWNAPGYPYSFVGADFQSWKVYAVSHTGDGAACTGCHRLGISSISGFYLENFNDPADLTDDGSRASTAQYFGPLSTAPAQPRKYDHSTTAPIWMLPTYTDGNGQVTANWDHDPEVEKAAGALAACATSIVKHENDASNPAPAPGCAVVRFGQGDTCPGALVQGEVNGATQSVPTSERVDQIIDVGGCDFGDEDAHCPLGFFYWTAVHGPFWQSSEAGLPLGDPAHRGSFLRIYVEEGRWKVRAFSDPTGGSPQPPPGGRFEGLFFHDLENVPDPNNCGSALLSVTDPDGSVLSDAVVLGASGANINVLTGFIGNIGQEKKDDRDYLRVFDEGANALLRFAHTERVGERAGPLVGEAWRNGCGGWTPSFAVQGVHSTSDAQLVSSADADKVRCFITGVTGTWAVTHDAGNVQPYAEIYRGVGGDMRLRVIPSDDDPTAPEAVGAYASCIWLQ